MGDTTWGKRPIIGWDNSAKNPGGKPELAINYAIFNVKSFLPMFCSLETFEAMIADGHEMTHEEFKAFKEEDYANFLASKV
jgi:hypothetical protein